MNRIIKVDKFYRHFKGHIIKVIGFAEHTETGENLVIYEHQKTKKIWARPYDMFNSLVDRDKYPDIMQKYRFEVIDE